MAVGCATSLYAPGGFGKSLLAQLLGSCVASGREFLGVPTMHAPVLGIFCEDDDDELWRRQCRINNLVSLRMTDLSAFAAQGRLGLPNLLMAFTKGKPPAALPLLAEIEAKAIMVGARLIILDNAAQLFGGEENARAEVTTFINELNGLARRLNAAVLMLGHPPKSGAEYSGSTAWHAAVRCMWTLTRAAEKEEDGEPSELMILTRSKANYAPGGAEIRLRWVDGVLRRDDGDVPTSGVEASFHRHNAKARLPRGPGRDDGTAAQRLALGSGEQLRAQGHEGGRARGGLQQGGPQARHERSVRRTGDRGQRRAVAGRGPQMDRRPGTPRARRW